MVESTNSAFLPDNVVILDKVIIDETEYDVTIINQSAFAQNLDITSVTLPAGIKEVRRYAFEYCTNLSEIKGIPETFEFVGDRAFNNTAWLLGKADTEPIGPYMAGRWVIGYVGEAQESIVFDNNTLGICYDFMNTINYTSKYLVNNIVLNEGLKHIGNNAFEYFMDLTEVHLPASLEDIGSNSFESCFAIEKFTVADGNSYFMALDGILYDIEQSTLLLYPCGKKDTYFIVPDVVKTIGKYAFFSANYIETLTIQEGVTLVDAQAIRQMNSLKTIILPSTLMSVGMGTFYNCNALKNIVLAATTPPDYGGVDLSLFTETTLYVPNSAIEDYKEAYGWKDLENIQPLELYSGFTNIAIDKTIENNTIFNIKGQHIVSPQKGEIYIKGGKKYLQRQ